MSTNTPQIVMAETGQIEAFDAIATEFFDAILGMDYSECFVSDESALSHFASCGMPEAMSEGAKTLPELYGRWDGWVLQEIENRYGVTLAHTGINLVDLFNRIQEAQQRTLQ